MQKVAKLRIMADFARTLENWEHIQELVSAFTPGSLVENGQLEKAQVATYALAMIDEVAEWAKEVGWKPWKNVERDDERVLDEFADIMAFFGLFLHYMNSVGFSMEDIVEAYYKKSVRNVERMVGLDDSYGNEPVNFEEAKNAIEFLQI